jgi:hypothetical protein
MGAWGLGNFENDDALDWIHELGGSDDLSAVMDALNAVHHNDEGYLDAGVCAMALAAVEVIAALRGAPPGDIPPEATAWVEAHHHLALNQTVLDEARSAISAILNKSELQELWGETDEYDAWRKVVAGLRKRL